MKAISMPVEMIVIIALAVIVLLAAAAFFTTGWLSPAGGIGDRAAWNTMCGQATQRGCQTLDFNNIKIKLDGYDPDGNGQADGIMVACEKVFGYITAAECRSVCCGSTSSSRTTPTADRSARTPR
ncbi:MAG: hypothetical protein ABIG30_03940 [Candidatus Aenigmatarchaeota archaeon]